MNSKIKPPAGTISADELCQLTGWTDSFHRQLAKDGFFPLPSAGCYEAKPTLKGCFRYARSQLEKKAGSLNAQKGALLKARAKKLQQETEILSGKWVEKSEIGPALTNYSLNQKRLLQYKLEQELPAQLVGQDRLFIEQKMCEVVDEICRVHLASTRQWMEVPP